MYIEGQASISILTKKLGLLGSIFLDILIVSPVDFDAIIHKLHLDFGIQPASYTISTTITMCSIK